MFSWLEKNPFFFAVAVFVVIAYAGIVEILPDFANRARPLESAKPYSVLELAGKNIYMQEGCNACHTQMIRPFKSETDRYGMYSLSGEFAYDRPHLWGSKRTGPDLMRVGDYRTTDWHENHMKDPISIVPGSIMPAYKHLFKKNADIETAYAEALTVKKVFNTPYDMPDMPKLGTFDESKAIVKAEAEAIIANMKDEDVKNAFKNGEIREIVALIAYLNSLK
ncbi:cytochrome-c oxidase, cbb3-type subunit II [Campylobacter sp. faydin G-24]|uniref:Cytochrome-c oxidase, cbb3-type subunit II n=1 Tax=Campylobacter anatolicus TaxID=2829105 RepID=A0ABS5HGS9_9BACT|nr:cytochrome-c oxidase, cbb3-type subunit II [Campylobacter anatolicus]MBR8463478.1 cytochrome-c oxidase, cbb3-type subunit II [Campylobacter anatolicus]